MALSRLIPSAASLILIALLARPLPGLQPSELLLPATTKGFISTHDVDEVRKKFNETQLGEMVNDPLMKPFIDDLKEQIAQKFERAGKRLGLKWNDLQGVYGGEVSLALIQPNPKDKMSHATALIVDITGKAAEARGLLAKIDANQNTNKAKKSALKIGGIDVTVYTQPLQPGEQHPEQSFIFIHNDQLICGDDKAAIEGIIGRLDGKAKDTLASVKAFEYSLDRSAKAAGDQRHHVRWFVEPFGYLEASRAAQGGKKKRGTDLLKILQTQGFTAIQGLGGYIFFATSDVEVLHRTFIYAPPNFALAMRMLDFPNSANPGDLESPVWALADVASYLSFNWNMKEAFDYSETLVDAIAGDKGVFKEMWVGLKTDPNGPMIDIYAGLVNHLGTRATLLSDVKLPVDLKSERLMALVELTDPGVVAKTLEKAFKGDPQAKKHLFRGQTIWEITQEENLAEESEIMIEGAEFVTTAAPAKPDEKDTGKDKDKDNDKEKKLPNTAITVYLGHLVVSTHVDFIEDLIKSAGAAKNLAAMDDYQRVRKSLTALGSQHDSVHFFSRTDESYRATYELLKQGRLPEAETILARLLNTMLGPNEDGVVRKQEIDGSKLPDFDKVKQYLGPGGVYAQSENDGWWIVGCLLKK